MSTSGRSFKFSAKKRALLGAMLEEAGLTNEASQRITRRASGDTLPLSSAQQRLWFLYQLEPDSAAYNVPTAVRLRGALNLAAVERSFQAIVQRHEALRTTFAQVDGQPAQRIADSVVVPIEQLDLGHIAEPERMEAARHHAIREAQRPFDLQRSPMLRVLMLRLDEHDHVLILTMHHIISDGWSAGLLVRELATTYTVFVGAVSTPSSAGLPPLPIQYGDFALWQREWLAGPERERQLEYWRAQLGGDMPVLELFPDRPRPAAQSYRGARHAFTLPHALSGALHALCQQEGATLFMALLTAFDVLLYRYTGQTDVAIGTPIANRNRAEIEQVIGFFVNTLILRVDLGGNPSFRTLLRRVRDSATGAYDHQDLPFELLVEELRPERSLSRTPLFQIMFALQNAPEPEVEIAGMKMGLLEFDSGMAQFDLLLDTWESSAGLHGSFNYSTDLFDAATIARLAEHFQLVLAGMVAQPDTSISALPLLTPAERRRLQAWNATPLPEPVLPFIHQAVFAQAARTPTAPALIAGTTTLSYHELTSRAAALAAQLQPYRLAPDTCVGVALPRTPDLVVALLAVLASGAAYLPLDPAYPPERLAFMLADTRAPLLLTTSALRPRFSAVPNVICLDELDDLPPTDLEALATPVLTPEHLAYIIYTSGSTGIPKGVAISHAAATTLLAWGRSTFAPEVLRGVLAATSVCFDLSVFELFVPLCAGGAVILADNVLQLPLLPAAHQVTLVNTVPSAMSELLRMEGLPPAVQVVNLAGEALPATLVEQLYQCPQVKQVWNLYGPSEDTTYSTGVCVPRDWDGAPPIGRPLPHTQAHVLDSAGQPVPIGVPGEIYLSSASLARGYLHRPGLTAERFVPSPFEPTTDSRMYKTGDLGRWRPDGQLEYLGRLDHQVKLRGFRIELGEIEATLRKHPQVAEAVVVVRPGATPDDQRLVAYFVQTVQDKRATADTEQAFIDHRPPSIVQELRAHIRQHLAEYMVPSIFVALPELPHTPSGKIDRKALPAPSSTRPVLGEGYIAPRTPTEDVLALAWQQILGLAQVGVHDNFFEVGGHSLLATQLVSRLRDALQVELPLRQVFESPTIAGLAAYVEELRNGTALQPIPPLAPAPRTGALPLSFAEQRLWFLEQLSPGNLGYTIPVVAHILGSLDTDAVELVARAVVRRHESLRTTFSEIDGEPVRVIHAADKLAFTRVDLRSLEAAAREQAVQRLLAAEARRPFDLLRGPLIRFTVIQLAPERFYLVFNVHHIVFDAWSMGVLIQEMKLLYEDFTHDHGQRTTDQLALLPPLPIQYADFAAWQRQWLQGQVLERQLDYWKAQLAGELPALNLPTDRPREVLRQPHGATRSYQLPPALVHEVARMSQRAGATPFMALLTAFYVLLHHYSGQTDIIVGTPIANRTHSELEGLVGFFVNTLAMRADLSGDPSIRNLLDRVRGMALGAFSNQDMPFERLIEIVRPERDLSRASLFEVLFIVQNVPMAATAPTNLTVELVQDDIGGGNFDLSLFVMDQDQGQLVLEYNTDLFEATTIDRVLTHYERVLASMVHQPDAPISALDLYALPERRYPDRPRLAAPTQRPTHDYITPRSELEQTLTAVWSELLGIEQISVRDRFFDLGGHSLLVVRLRSAIQKRLGRKLPLLALFQATTIEQLADLLQRPASTHSSSLVALQPDGLHPPIFCVHHGGGSALGYNELARLLGPNQPFYGFQARGLDGEAPPVDDIPTMAGLYLQELRVVQPHGPYLLGGWSLGGIVAFEMACQLETLGERTALLALFDSQLAKPADLPADDDPGVLLGFFQSLGLTPDQLALEQLEQLAPAQQFERAIELARQLQALPADVERAQVERWLQVFRTNLRAMHRYQPGPYGGRITLFRAAETLADGAPDPADHWAPLAAKGVAAETIDCNHYTMMQPPHVYVLAHKLRAYRDAALNHSGEKADGTE